MKLVTDKTKTRGYCELCPESPEEMALLRQLFTLLNAHDAMFVELCEYEQFDAEESSLILYRTDK